MVIINYMPLSIIYMYSHRFAYKLQCQFATWLINLKPCYKFYLIFLDVLNAQGIDILAGVEAIISHLVVKEFQIPCAHAPALLPLPLSMSLCPKSAAEEVSRLSLENKGPNSLIYVFGELFCASIYVH